MLIGHGVLSLKYSRAHSRILEFLEGTAAPSQYLAFRPKFRRLVTLSHNPLKAFFRRNTSSSSSSLLGGGGGSEAPKMEDSLSFLL